MGSRDSSRRRYRDFIKAYRERRIEVDDTPGQSPDDPSPDTPPEKIKHPFWAIWRRTGSKRDYLGDYIKWLKPYRGNIGGLFLFAVMMASLEMVEPLFMRFIVDKVLLAPALETSERLRLLNMAGALFLTVIVATALLRLRKDFLQRQLNAKLMLTLRRSLFDRFLRLPLPKLWEMKTGGILSRLTGDVDTTTGLLQMAIISPALSVLRLVFAVGILFALNWRLALAALTVIPGAMAISFLAARRIRPIYRSIRKDAEQIDGRVGETFSGIRVVRGFGQEVLELLTFLRGRHTVVRKELFAHRRELVLWTSWGLLVSGVNVVIVWYGGKLTVAGAASIGDIMAFQWYSFLLLNPVWSIVNSFSELQRSLAATERVFNVLSLEPEKPDKPGATEAPRDVRELRFEHVGFEYRVGRPVLHDLGIVVAGGTVVALVGRSGAGKTTVTDLVARFHDPTTGRILLNGTDIRDFTLKSYRDLLAIVQQEVFLFDGSVRENIAYGRHDATDAEVEDAARRANAEEFIVRLPNGYETSIGERGVKLSGGQQQRLAIARAILADPRILILDEATSNLDTESEQLIQAAMGALLKGRTTFVIAHRLSTIRRADLILLLEDGRIIERGTHESLLRAGGVYAAMVRRQAEAADDSDVIPAFSSAEPTAHHPPDPGDR
jgi:ATP-binding cassette subfamily B protein